MRRPVGGGGGKVAKAGGGASVVAAKPVRVRGNFRPQGVMAKPEKSQNPYQAGTANMRYRVSAKNDDKKARLANAQVAKSFFESQGLSVKFSSSRNSATIASVHPFTKEVLINRSHTSWINPAKAAATSRGSREFSSSSPMHVVYHEMGHARDKKIGDRVGPFGGMWALATRKGPSEEQRAERANQMRSAARRVSYYATKNPSEFIAETYAGRRTGHRYDSRVMSAYREAAGLPGIRTGSRVAPGGTALASPRAVARDRARRRRKP